MSNDSQTSSEGNGAEPVDENERRVLILFGPDAVRELRERQAKKARLEIPSLVRNALWRAQFEPERSTEEGRRRLWPRLAAHDAGYQPYEFAKAFTELLEMERVGHCAAYKTDYWWHAEHKLWLRDSRGNLMHRLLVQHFGSDIEGWLADGDEDERRSLPLPVLQQVIDFARRAPSIALSPADVDPSPAAELLDGAAMRSVPAARSLLTFQGQRIMPANALGVIVGDSATYKSYFLVKCAAAMAGGKPFADFDLAAERTGVIYVGAEDADGLAHRLTEARDQLGLGDDLPLRLYNQPLVMTDTDAVLDFITAAKQALATPVGLVVLDTYNQTLGPGDAEDSADTARNYALNMRLINRALGGPTVIAVHHPTKSDPTGDGRGSGAIRHNTDFMLGFAREPGSMKVGVTCKKQKNGVEFAPFTLAFASSAEGIVLAGVEAGARARPAKAEKDPLPGKKGLALRALALAGNAGLAWTEWMAATGVARSTLSEAKAALEDLKLIACVEGRYGLTTQGVAQAAARGWEASPLV